MKKKNINKTHIVNMLNIKKLLLFIFFVGAFMFNSNAQVVISNLESNGNTGVSQAGVNLSYTIILLNNGSQDLTGVSISDILPNASSATLVGPIESISSNGMLNIGETWTYTTSSYTVTAADITAGSDLVNTASVTTTETGATIFSANRVTRIYEDDFDEVTITVNSTITVPTITSNSPICSGEDAIFTITGDVGNVITYTGAVSGTATVGAGGTVDVTVSGVNADTTLNLTNANDGSCDLPLTSSTTVTVNALPSAPAITGDTEVCLGDTITNLATTAVGTIVWSSSNTAVATIDAATGVVTPVSTGTTNITYIVTDGNTCSSTSAIHVVTVNALPSAPAITGDTEVCMGDTITNLATTAVGTIVWSSSNTAVATINPTTGVVSPVSAGTTNITYTVTDGNTCSSTSANHVVTVNALPGAPAITGDTEVCIGDTITNLATTATGTIVWSSSNTAVATIDAVSGVVTPVSTGSTNISYTVFCTLGLRCTG